MKQIHTHYPANIEPDGKRWKVTFRDIPEALTAGSTREQAVEMASDALATALEFYVENGREVPAASRPKRGEVVITPKSAATPAQG